MGQQTLDRPAADVEEHKYKPHGDQAIDCTKDSCKPISMEQLQKDLGPEQFKKYQEHAASEATKNEYFHPESDAGKMMNGFSVSGLGKKGDAADTTDKLEKASQKEGKKDTSQENNLFGDERNEIPAGKKQDAGSDKTKDNAKVDDKPKSEWDKQIEASGASTVSEAGDAYKKAFNEGKGLAIAIVGKDTPGSKELLDKLPELQKANPNLNFMVVDKDAVAQKLAENPNDKSMQNWDKWIKDNQKDCAGEPIDMAKTSVQSLKVDENGKTGPEKVTSTHWGANIEAGLADQARYAADATGRNLAASQTDFSPNPPVKPSEKTDTKSNTEVPAETSKQQTNGQGQSQNQSNKGKEQETQNQESKAKESEAAKEETPFLKEEKEQVDNKAKEEQEAKDTQAKEAQATKDTEAAKEKEKPETSEQQEAAKKLEQEQQLERQKRIKEATDHKYSGNDIEEVKRLSRELGLPIVMEIGFEGTDPSNPCPPCRQLNSAMENGLADDMKGRALVMKSGLGELGGRIGQQIPGFSDGSGPGTPGNVPYSTTGYVGTDGKIHALGSPVRGFSGADHWRANMNDGVDKVNKLFDKYRKNK